MTGWHRPATHRKSRMRFTPQFLDELRARRSEEHTSELQSQSNLVCRLLLEKKNVNVIRVGSELSAIQPSPFDARRSEAGRLPPLQMGRVSWIGVGESVQPSTV